MASLSADRGGRFRILFTHARKRRQLYLGDVGHEEAQEVLGHVEQIVRALGRNRLPVRPTQAWLDGLGDEMRRKLERVELLERQQESRQHTLQELIDRFEKTSSVKDGTLRTYQQAGNSLLGFFGEDQVVEKLTQADADDWRAELAESDLARATINKRVRVARQIFKRAVAWKWLADNPFAGLRAGSESNSKRLFYVDREAFAAVMAACPSPRWRGILALSRFAGLRCPSETGALRWGDVLWDRGRIVVHSSKTEDHDGQDARVVPMAPELRTVLQDLFDHADEGQVYVVPGLTDASTNLRTEFTRIIARAGLKPWPRLFHNLRSSCETDWCDDFPDHAVAKWLGHSVTVQRSHYLQVKDSHFDAAAGLACAHPSAHSSAHKTTQQTSAGARKSPQDPAQVPPECGLTLVLAGPGWPVPNAGMTPPGFEHHADLPAVSGRRRSGARASAHHQTRSVTPAESAVLSYSSSPASRKISRNCSTALAIARREKPSSGPTEFCVPNASAKAIARKSSGRWAMT